MIHETAVGKKGRELNPRAAHGSFFMFASPKVIRFVCLLFNFQTRRSLEILAVFDMDQMITYYIVCIHFAIFFPSFAIRYLGGKESATARFAMFGVGLREFVCCF